MARKICVNGDRQFPAGLYYVGDLCYVLADRWDEFCDITITERSCLDGVFTLKDGTVFATYGTMYGDGCYSDQYGNEYGVDAGLIGCVAMEYINPNIRAQAKTLGAVIEMPVPFTTSFEDGTIYIGHLVIPTGDDEDHDVASGTTRAHVMEDNE